MNRISPRRVIVQPDEVSEISREIPVPESRSRYPLARLQVGESFSCPASRRASIRSTICLVRKTYPERMFTIRSEPDHQNDRIRIWRTR
jgi:hypothetical protein